MPPSLSSAGSPSKHSRCAGSERRKHKRKKLQTPVDTSHSGAYLCPHVRGLLPVEQHWSPSVTSSPRGEGLAFPSALVVPSQAPYLLPSFPLQDIASQGGGGSAAWGAAAGWPPLSAGPQAIPAFPSAILDTLMTIFLHSAPLFPLWPASFSPYPSLGAAASQMAPLVPATAPNLEPTSSDHGQRSMEENWETDSEEFPIISSRSSSPLQLNLLQEEMPAPPESEDAVRRGAGPDAKHVSTEGLRKPGSSYQARAQL